ncbi:hypothetical protein KGQ27_03470 [Patescibacteria group bacterium]|nr:hypothetical protein [Patescibacteria group bacterium]MDE1946912.1 hypothetical protein [Patescibacteria group bacterium]MDE2011113.1 hypothetical protein [Patescibacteria group bacterium]MDE2233195.1 hypothetical protein [Patescibacteria group bacterium]
MGASAVWRGTELENAYADILGGRMNGGFNDHGKDIVLADDEIPAVQVKSSLHFALEFLKESLKRRQFIPLCVGEPASRHEILTSLREYGAWVGYDIPNRGEVLDGIVRVKELCGA